ncbi:uncharacterized protein HMPREF1541_05660 [Cyphellophora europaea CBS 101466]|uniref:Uncharacterized protein n=1 Tax=Cyphellophora europaea (strain CBS 101466) TaxID=1220924 RepID=W2RSM6_CYPE1|nr:uncharacterized protein HMPREF1541_05660 [Cyphellophora europaea CBS 101466]ETN39437.1 hypothetical protein HMPREF1541_05660 [Cyphellophora europaea CBS 101466]
MDNLDQIDNEFELAAPETGPPPKQIPPTSYAYTATYLREPLYQPQFDDIVPALHYPSSARQVDRPMVPPLYPPPLPHADLIPVPLPRVPSAPRPPHRQVLDNFFPPQTRQSRKRKRTPSFDQWGDTLAEEDFNLVIVLTLDGRSTKTIGRQLKMVLPPAINHNIEKPEYIFEIQKYVGTLFHEGRLIGAFKPTVLNAMIEGFLKWCTGQDNNGLRTLARAKEADDYGDDKAQLRALAQARKNHGATPINEQYGYTTAWAQEQTGEWRNMMEEWWTKGTVKGKNIPEQSL